MATGNIPEPTPSPWKTAVSGALVAALIFAVALARCAVVRHLFAGRTDGGVGCAAGLRFSIDEPEADSMACDCLCGWMRGLVGHAHAVHDERDDCRNGWGDVDSHRDAASESRCRRALAAGSCRLGLRDLRIRHADPLVLSHWCCAASRRDCCELAGPKRNLAGSTFCRCRVGHRSCIRGDVC